MAHQRVTEVAPHHPWSIDYKWIALSNTTLGVLMAALNQTSLIIALPAIFRGIAVDPLAPGQTGLLLWVLLGFNIATTVFLVTFGRLSDSKGRVRLYNLGFLVFTVGSILLSLTPGKGLTGEGELIAFRFIQGLGGAFLFANSSAILTDAFPVNQRGFALGLNQLAAVGGSVVGLVVGGILATIHWRWVFLINVPFGIFGTVWAYVALREMPGPRPPLEIDWVGNLTFGLGLLAVLLALTYSILPWGGHVTGWHNPFVIGALAAGIALLLAFVLVEGRVRDPLMDLRLFRTWAFTAGNIAGMFAAVARGGLSFMLVIWLQGIWLPLHGVPFAATPLKAGIDLLPQMAGFVAAGPISGKLSDRYGARWFGFAGMALSALGFYELGSLPVHFHYWTFAWWLFLVGAGQGLFASPNTAAIMNSVPPRYRGVASGMRSTFMNAGMMLSMGLFFTLLISTLAVGLPSALMQGLTQAGLPAADAARIAHLPPIASLFAALLGYNPMRALLGPAVLARLSPARVAALTSIGFFPNLISRPFMAALHTVFVFSAIISLVAAVLSALRGRAYAWETENRTDSHAGERP
ncbi:MAG: MFS transporter [Firmicutes bacterium]|nr:MFS transporter [Alicyclobacillaceae bacterium]MCL6496638.1 MFS transporter [Bacillota bacterium]